MSHLRNLILRRIAEIKNTECGFTTEFWKTCYVSFRPLGTDDDITKKISEVNFDREVSDWDLGRLFEYIIRNQETRMQVKLISAFDTYKYHSLCARATLFPGKTYEEVEAILEEQRTLLENNTDSIV